MLVHNTTDDCLQAINAIKTRLTEIQSKLKVYNETLARANQRLDVLENKFNPNSDVMGELANTIDDLDNVQLASLRSTISEIESNIASNSNKFEELLGELHQLLNP